MPSLNLDLNYFGHRKTKRLIGLLGRGAEVLPIRLWCYCGMHHAESGRLADYSPQEIETIVEWWGKPGEAIKALETVGFLDLDTHGIYSVHEWQEHEGHIVSYQKRAKTAAKARWDNDIGDDAPSNALSNAKSKSKQCQNSAGQRSAKKPPDPLSGEAEFAALIPPELDVPHFRSAWAKWETHRREIRHALKPTMVESQMKWLSALGANRAVAAIDYTILKGWQGLRESEGKNGTNGLARASTSEEWRRKPWTGG